jgi:hypothetical protein
MNRIKSKLSLTGSESPETWPTKRLLREQTICTALLNEMNLIAGAFQIAAATIKRDRHLTGTSLPSSIPLSMLTSICITSAVPKEPTPSSSHKQLYNNENNGA